MILSMCNNAVINHSGFLFHVGAAVCGTWKYPSNSSYQWEHLKVQSLHFSDREFVLKGLLTRKHTAFDECSCF